MNETAPCYFKSALGHHRIDECRIDRRLAGWHCRIDESLINESLIDESLINESLIDESLIDESLIDESLIDESLINESLIDRHLAGWRRRLDRRGIDRSTIGPREAHRDTDLVQAVGPDDPIHLVGHDDLTVARIHGGPVRINHHITGLGAGDGGVHAQVRHVIPRRIGVDAGTPQGVTHQTGAAERAAPVGTESIGCAYLPHRRTQSSIRRTSARLGGRKDREREDESSN